MAIPMYDQGENCSLAENDRAANLVDEIVWSLDELEKTTSVLSARLASVSNQYQEPADSICTPTPEASCRLREQLWRLQNVNGRVSVLISQLEV